jgi:hypothetical protein
MAGPLSEDDMFLWEAFIQGPEGTPFEGGVFPAELKFPKDYPLAPPTMRFLVDVWHPNGMYRMREGEGCRARVGMEEGVDGDGRDVAHGPLSYGAMGEYPLTITPSLRQRQRMHINPTPTGRRPEPVRASVRALESDTERREDIDQRHEHAGRAER